MGHYGDIRRGSVQYRRYCLRVALPSLADVEAGGVGGQCRCVRGSHRIRAVSDGQLASCNGVAYSRGRGYRSVRPCGRGERSRGMGRLKLSALTRSSARGMAGAGRSPSVRRRARCGSRTRPNTTQRLVQHPYNMRLNPRMHRRSRSGASRLCRNARGPKRGRDLPMGAGSCY